ncbi:MAG: restriction endonuclease subunit S [Nitrospira sp.]|nr:restriction endonuclease subunit S [Nitrospira sp.]MCC7472336.1 restriction endonuclease subunit S [Candidatus Nomurabacteria bacterium]
MTAAAWKNRKLGDLLKIKHGYAFKGEFFSDEGNFVLLTPGNFREEGGLKLKGEKEKYYAGEIPEDFVLRKGDLLVAMTDLTQNAPILGSPAFVPESGRFLHNQRLGKVTNIRHDEVVPEFLFYLLNTTAVRGQIKGSASGATVRHTSPARMYDVSVNIPPLPVQRRIAGILSAYDDLIENNQRRIKILEEMARSLYREWFVHFRFPGHDKIKMVSSRLGPIPQGWKIVRVDDVCELVTDGSHSSPKSIKQGLPMASSKDMHEWGLNLEGCRYISRQDFDQLVRNGCKPKKNDVLITKDGANYLKHIFVVREEQELVLLSSIAILRPNEMINPHLLTAILSAQENKDRLKNYVTGAAIPRIILSDFKRFTIVLPSEEVQGAWAKIGEPITQLCWRLVEQTANLQRTRDLLLPRLLSGQIPLSC